MNAQGPTTPPLSRIAPCPCGSGKRYKHCHGALIPDGIEPKNLFPGGPSPDVIRRMAAAVQQIQDRAFLFGKTGLPNTIEFGGRRIVGVGGSIFAVDPKQTPLNFMAGLLVEARGRTWFETELAGNGSQPEHPIVTWYRAAMDWQQRHANADGLVQAKMTGPVKSWFQLEYDVWLLSHHQLLVPLLDRLRDRNQFVRAGYKIEPEDGAGMQLESLNGAWLRLRHHKRARARSCRFSATNVSPRGLIWGIYFTYELLNHKSLPA